MRSRECFGDGRGPICTRKSEKDLRHRDNIDSTREFAPLKKADDAIYLDTTELTIEEAVGKVLGYIQ